MTMNIKEMLDLVGSDNQRLSLLLNFYEKKMISDDERSFNQDWYELYQAVKTSSLKNNDLYYNQINQLITDNGKFSFRFDVKVNTEIITVKVIFTHKVSGKEKTGSTLQLPVNQVSINQAKSLALVNAFGIINQEKQQNDVVKIDNNNAEIAKTNNNDMQKLIANIEFICDKFGILENEFTKRMLKIANLHTDDIKQLSDSQVLRAITFTNNMILVFNYAKNQQMFVIDLINKLLATVGINKQINRCTIYQLTFNDWKVIGNFAKIQLDKAVNN